MHIITETMYDNIMLLEGIGCYGCTSFSILYLLYTHFCVNIVANQHHAYSSLECTTYVYLSTHTHIVNSTPLFAHSNKYILKYISVLSSYKAGYTTPGVYSLQQHHLCCSDWYAYQKFYVSRESLFPICLCLIWLKVTIFSLGATSIIP